jgi:hypothetical protein
MVAPDRIERGPRRYGAYGILKNLRLFPVELIRTRPTFRQEGCRFKREVS